MPKVSFAYGDNICDITNKAIDLEGSFEKTFKDKSNILVLINVVGAHNFESGTTTAPDVVRCVVERLKNLGKEVTICGSSWYGGRTSEPFRILKFFDLANELGCNLVDIKKDEFIIVKVKNSLALDKIKLSNLPFFYDGLISIPTFKTHRSAKISLAMKSLMGFLHDSYKRKFHTFDLSKSIVDLCSLVDIDYAILDGIYGKIGDEIYGDSIKMNFVSAADNIYALDIIGANVLGYDFLDVAHLYYAKERGLFSFDENNIEILGDLKKYQEKVEIPKEAKDKFRSLNIVERDACCPCFASLVYAVERLNNEEISKLKGVPIYIGQNVKNPEKGIFLGQCNRKYKDQGLFVRGCPTKAHDIYKALKEYLDD